MEKPKKQFTHDSDLEENETRKKFKPDNNERDESGNDEQEDLSDSDNYDDIDYGDDEDFNIDNHLGDVEQSQQTTQDEHQNMEEAQLGNNNEDGEQEEGEKIPSERCKYWPSCNAGDECTYYHPTKPCRAFPNCRFGKKCLYIHPTCKFSPNCTRPGCRFAHPSATSNLRQVPKCKFGFNCMNLMCKFSHHRSEPCRFGANCLLETCAYTHPEGTVRKKPSSAFKWSAQSP